MEFYASVIRNLATKPIRSIGFNSNTVCVEYEDGQILSEKFDLACRMFLITLQNVHYRRKEASPDCISIPLGYFQLFGWKEGDVVGFYRDDLELAIVFS